MLAIGSFFLELHHHLAFDELSVDVPANSIKESLWILGGRVDTLRASA